MSASKKTQLFGRQWLPVIVWMVLIFLFSNQPHSGAVTVVYFGSWNVLVRKGAHLVEYLVLCLLSERAFRLSNGVVCRHSLSYGFALSSIYAITDEWHQSFVPGRSSTILDVLVDVLGALIASAWIAIRVGFVCQKQ
jgi:VanZ family protein